MKHVALLCSALLVLTTACRDPGPPAAENEAKAPEDSAPMAVATSNIQTQFSAPLPGGATTLPFPYHISVDREVPARDGRLARELVIEFLGPSVEDADSALWDALRGDGLERVSHEESGRSTRSIYSLPDGGQLLVWVRPTAPRGERYQLQVPDATGTIYLAWPFVTAEEE